MNLSDIDKNLLLKLNLHRANYPMYRDITVHWNVYGKQYDFVVGKNYLPLTLLINRNGKLTIETENDIHNLVNNSSFVINEARKFRLAYQSPNSSDVLVVFFSKDFVRRLIDDTTEGEFVSFKSPDQFFEKVQNEDVIYSNIYENIISDFDSFRNNELHYKERAEELMTNIILNQRSVLNEINTLPFKRKSTKLEIYKRLNRSVDYMQSCFSDNLLLDDIAKHSALSKYHFLRMFKLFYKTTPFEYILLLRINKAKELLQTSNKSISEICYELGFESVPTFITKFRKRTGLTPGKYRVSAVPFKKAI